MKLSEIRDLLTQRDIKLTKSLGQNFLHDGNQLRRIVESAALTGSDRVLEIGPGLGPLTELLVARAGEVLAIEKDARLVQVLQEKFRTAKNLSLVPGDALKLLRQEPRDWSNWKLVANLPYSVASPILVELAQSPRRPRMLVATLQLEVVRRIVAQAGDADYGILSLLLQLRYEPLGHFKIPADCFFPAPEVDSACVTLRRRESLFLPLDQEPAFEHIVKAGFSQRRKQMQKLLKEHFPENDVAEAFARLGLEQQIRAEKVTLEQFVNLTQHLAGKTP